MSEYSAFAWSGFIGIPVQDWKGRCYEVSCAIVNHGLLVYDAEPVYGSWLGPIAPSSYFADRRGSAFVRHGWIVDANGDIIDPTRWVFEGAEPYIYVGEDDEGYYDRGNDVFREMIFRQKPVPVYDPDDQQLSLADLDEFDRMVLKHLLCEHRKNFSQVSKAQYFYLANAPMSLLGPTAAPLYRLLIGNGLGALIPIDNRDMVLGTDREER